MRIESIPNLSGDQDKSPCSSIPSVPPLSVAPVIARTSASRVIPRALHKGPHVRRRGQSSKPLPVRADRSNDSIANDSATERNESGSSIVLAPDTNQWLQAGVSPMVVGALALKGITVPTPIQTATLSAALKGRCNIVAAAETGSGKTLCFAVPIVHFLINALSKRIAKDPQARLPALSALVLVPNRELGLQIEKQFTSLLTVAVENGLRITVATLLGGLSALKQYRLLSYQPDIIIATPGRLDALLGEQIDGVYTGGYKAPETVSGPPIHVRQPPAVAVHLNSTSGGDADGADSATEGTDVGISEEAPFANQCMTELTDAESAAFLRSLTGKKPAVAQHEASKKRPRGTNADSVSGDHPVAACQTAGDRTSTAVKASHVKQVARRAAALRWLQQGVSPGLRFVVIDEADVHARPENIGTVSCILARVRCDEDGATPSSSSLTKRVVFVTSATIALGDHHRRSLAASEKAAVDASFASVRSLSAPGKKQQKLQKKAALGEEGLVGDADYSVVDGTHGRSPAGSSAAGALLRTLGVPADKALVFECSTHGTVAEKVTKTYSKCLSADKDAHMLYFLRRYCTFTRTKIESVFDEFTGQREAQNDCRTIIFTPSAKSAKHVAGVLRCVGTLRVAVLHSDMQQRDRLKALDRLRDNSDCILVATDVCARGLDIPDVRYVFQYSTPHTSETYVHRVGRTARAGRKGLAHILVTPEELASYQMVIANLGGDTPPKPLAIVQSELEEARQIAIEVRRLMEAEKELSSLSAQLTKSTWVARTAADIDIDIPSDLDDTIPVTKKRKPHRGRCGQDIEAPRTEACGRTAALKKQVRSLKVRIPQKFAAASSTMRGSYRSSLRNSARVSLHNQAVAQADAFRITGNNA